MDRRRFLQAGLGTAATAGLAGPAMTTMLRNSPPRPTVGELPPRRPPAYSLIPVVGDGYWIDNDPPKGAEGYYHPRLFEARIGIEMEGTGRATKIRATTPVPVEYPEQKFEDFSLETSGCEAAVRPLADTAAELVLASPGLVEGGKLRAMANFRLKLTKQYLGFVKDQFPAEQTAPREVQRQYLGNSPGIQTLSREVRTLSKKLADGADHPWDQIKKFVAWIRGNIRGRVGAYTHVLTALEKKEGDCEEMAAVLVALCRSAQIPARLVWVPNHNWTEVYLADGEGQGHWVPVHTGCYSWFGWTGAHELVLQKGDRIALKEKRSQTRLLCDWARWVGAAPKIRFIAELRPIASTEGEDPGPGARSKTATGEWKLVGNHEFDRYARR